MSNYGTLGATIVQPILQWGYNGVFGAASWTAVNEYVWNGSADGAYSEPETNVPPGTDLTLSIVYNGQGSDGSYKYTSSIGTSVLNVSEGNVVSNFYTNSTVSLPAIPQATTACETLECYQLNGQDAEVEKQSDYPNAASANMRNISMYLANGNPAPLSWTTEINTPIQAFGEHTVVQSNNAVGTGEILDICFKPLTAPGISGAPVDLYEGRATVSGTITAAPSQVVNVELSTFAKDAGLTQTITFTFTTSLVDFYTGGLGGNSETVTNGSVTERFLMPSSGTVNWTATYSQTGGSSHPYDGASVQVF